MCSSHGSAIAAGNAHAPREVLPTNVVPRHYKLFLEPDLVNYTYTGSVEIDLDVVEPSKTVSVNILNLDIKSATLDSVSAVSSDENKDSQTITWTFPNEIKPKSKASLKVEFEGTLNDQLAGFYRSVHKDEKGNTQVVATTQMEATDCRRAFPCFDEPSIKATFDISIAADPSLTVLSNSDVRHVERRNDGKAVTHFNTTPKMSTYLVAFVVGDLRYVESNAFRVPVRVYATPGMEDRCQFSADLAAKTLGFFEKTFGIEYPLPKCDMVGVHDFSAGAMENWGLITYRLTDIFYTEGKDPVSAKIRVAEVVQHELAHQWFGNLVTMEWWDGLWLNEGFATWMSWYSSNHFFPEWKVWQTYVTDQYNATLKQDGIRSSHPIQVPVKRADEINQIFDAISYLKGSCVIRMVSQSLGEDVFFKGISLYLNRHKYGNTTTDDLWAALSEASGKDVKTLMNVWTKEVGYPVLTVKENGSGTIDVEQHRYLETADVKPEEDKTLYPLYLSVRDPNGSVDHEVSLDSRKATFKIDPEFYKVNANQTGLFRVSYPDDRVGQLASEGVKAANGKSRLTPEDRIGLLLDLGALASSGYTKTSQLLTVATSWRQDPEPNVWAVIVAQLNEFNWRIHFESDAIKDAFSALLKKVFIPKLKQLGLESKAGEDVNVTRLRSTLLLTALKLKSQEYIDFTLNEFATKGFDVSPDIRSAVFQSVARYGSPEQWQQLYDHYKAGTHGVSGIQALNSLGNSNNPEVIKKVLNFIIDGTTRSQDVIDCLRGIMETDQGQLQLWEFFKKEYVAITKQYPPSGTLMTAVVICSLRNFTQKSQLEDAEAFFAGKDLRGIDQAVRQSLDKIRATVSYLEHALPDIQKWLSESKL